MTTHSLVPTIPKSADTVYLVLDDFSVLGRAWVETDETHADRETIIRYLLTDQYGAPVRVAAFNLSEGWAKDVSGEIAKEVAERARLERLDLPPAVQDFVELHVGQVASYLKR